MAIYKLSEFCKFKRGVLEKPIKTNPNSIYPIISAGVNYKGYYPKYNRDGKYICISVTGASAGHVTYYEGKFWASRCFTLELNNFKILKTGFFKFLLLKSEKEIKSFGVGSVRSDIYWKDIKNISVNTPSLKEQQKIIDIIEPKKHLFEKYSNCIRIDSFENTQKDLQKIIDIIEPINYLKNNIKSIENKINFLVKNQSFKGFKEMYKFVKFNKGSIVKSTEFIYKNDQSNLIPFIDIKSLTGIVNKYLDNRKYKSNTQIGDVLLSLDGAPGRVSITNNGYNGYAYKINSNTISNAIIWASLINKINQKIIKKHSYGTTILHANTSKQLLLILNFKNVELIKILYQIKLLIFKIQQLIKNIYNLMLQLLIK